MASKKVPVTPGTKSEKSPASKLMEIIKACAAAVAEHGHDEGDWGADDGNPGFLVSRRFSGDYTIPEVKALLQDMEKVQLLAEKRTGTIASSPEADQWNIFCGRYNLLPSDFHQEFTSPNTSGRYRVTGLKTTRGKYPILCERVSDGRKFKFAADTVRRALRPDAGSAEAHRNVLASVFPTPTSAAHKPADFVHTAVGLKTWIAGLRPTAAKAIRGEVPQILVYGTQRNCYVNDVAWARAALNAAKVVVHE